jgi:hypothetical protein
MLTKPSPDEAPVGKHALRVFLKWAADRVLRHGDRIEMNFRTGATYPVGSSPETRDRASDGRHDASQQLRLSLNAPRHRLSSHSSDCPLHVQALESLSGQRTAY